MIFEGIHIATSSGVLKAQMDPGDKSVTLTVEPGSYVEYCTI